MIKKVFILLAVLPLIFFLLGLNNWFPYMDQIAKVAGIPFSIFAVLVLLSSQVVLAWTYLGMFEKQGEQGD